MTAGTLLESNSTGPCLEARDVPDFLGFCKGKGYNTRLHQGPTRGYNVRFNGHWMVVLWNKSRKRFTVDSRLSEVLKEFRESRAAPRKRVEGTITLKKVKEKTGDELKTKAQAR